MRLTYWTSAPLEPGIEAVSQEVADLARHFSASRVIGINPHLKVAIREKGRILGFHPSFDPLLRLAVPWLESGGDVNHVYGDVVPWTLIKTLRRKPTVLTICAEHGVPPRDFLDRCGAVTVQTSHMLEIVRNVGVDASRLRLVYPGVDLTRFKGDSRRTAAEAPRILFATFPRAAGELEERGVDFLLQMAAAFGNLKFTLVSRPWKSGGTALDAVLNVVAERKLHNVEILQGVQPDMDKLYRQHDFTVIPFTRAEGGKECPRSLVETLACGVPVLISNVAPFSKYVTAEKCGAVFELNAGSFEGAVRQALANYSALSANAAACAQKGFDVSATFASYADIYAGLTRRRTINSL